MPNRAKPVGLRFLLLALLVCLAGAGDSLATPTEPPFTNTGAPDHSTCMQCHFGNAAGGSLDVTFSDTALQYIPGDTYTINVEVAHPDLDDRRSGFSMVAREVSATTVKTVGSWILGADPNVGEYGVVPNRLVGHDGPVTASGTSQIYNVQWQAPAALTGDIRFYVSAVAGGPNDAPGASSDDFAYTSSFTISEIVPPSVVSTTADNGPGSLREVIANAPPGDKVTFATQLEGQTISLNGSEILLDKNLNIDASAVPGGVTVSAGGLSRVFQIAAGTSIDLQSLNITGGDWASSGGGIFNSGVLTLTDCSVSGNSSDSSGGGIFNDGELTLTGCSIADNSTGSSGGGVFNDALRTVDIVESTLSRNHALGSGGGLFSDTLGLYSVVNSTIDNNRAEISGGGIQSFQTNFGTISDSEIISNSAGNDGGGISYVSGLSELTNSTLHANTATFAGGGIYVDSDSLLVSQSTFSGNSADLGGGIYNDTDLAGTTTVLANCTLAGNSATFTGGGIYNFDGDLVLNHVTVSGNSAPVGGGGGVSSYGDTFTQTRVWSSIVSANESDDVGFSFFEDNNSFQSGGYNFIGTGEGIAAFSTVGASDIVGNSVPRLGPLCNNGGLTKTMRPLAGSPAIDTGGTDFVPDDQRGFPRPFGPANDIGAVEVSNLSYDLEWTGVGNSAIATGRITFEPDQLVNPGLTTFSDLAEFTITINGASLGNGTFDRTDYDLILLNTGALELDFASELVGQPTATGTWGTPLPDGAGGDFYLVPGGESPNAPGGGAEWFEIVTSGGESLFLTSFRPASLPPPANSVVHPPDLASAFASRSILFTAPGSSAPAPIATTSDGSTQVWQWTPGTNGWFDINTFGSSFDTRLVVYEGSAPGALALIAENDDAFPGEFATDHPEPDRSAVILPLFAGKTYQFAIIGGANGELGGALSWRISPSEEPLPPAVEVKTHFPFNFLPAEYSGGTALIDTIVPVGDFGTDEAYVHVLDTQVGSWNTVEQVGENVVDSGPVTVRPYLGAGSTIRLAEAGIISSLQRLSAPVAGGFTNPPSDFPGPFVTVAAARYPHRYGIGNQSICVDLSAEAGQGYGLTHMPREHLDDPSEISPGKGGLQVNFHYLGNPPVGEEPGFALVDSSGTEIDYRTGPDAERLISDLDPGGYSLTFDEITGYRIVISREGEGIPDESIPNINLLLPNIIEAGNRLVNARRDICVFFPNSPECKHFTRPNFEAPFFTAISGCEVREDMVTVINVQYVELGTGTEAVGYFGVPDPTKVLDDFDVTGGESNPFTDSPLVHVSESGETKVLVMEPDEEADIGRVVKWKKQPGADWVKWRNFVSLGVQNCFDCHTQKFDDLPGALGRDGESKPGGGAPRVPWFVPVGGERFTVPIADRLVPAEDEPFTLAILDRPFDRSLNFRMPIDIEENAAGMPPRSSWVEYARQRWYIQQAAGAGYLPTITVVGPSEITLEPASSQYSLAFEAAGDWFAETIGAPWITFENAPFGTGNGVLTLKFSPNPGARPRFGTVAIYDLATGAPTFFNVIQPLEPIDLLSIDSLRNPPGFRFNINGINGVTYKVEFTESLASPTWQVILSEDRGREETPLMLETLFPVDVRRGFYRVSGRPTPVIPP